MSLIGLIVWVLILGLIAYLISAAPFISAPFKTIANYILIVIAVIVVISFLLGLSGATGTGLYLR